MTGQLTTVCIYVWRGKAYIPVLDQIESGAFMITEPVFVAQLTIDSLVEILKRIIASGHKRVPDPTREEIRQRKDPLLKATGMRNWKALAKTGASYMIGWTGKEIRIDMSRLDKQGRWENDPDKVQILPPTTSLETIVRLILEDIGTRPQILS